MLLDDAWALNCMTTAHKHSDTNWLNWISPPNHVQRFQLPTCIGWQREKLTYYSQTAGTSALMGFGVLQWHTKSGRRRFIRFPFHFEYILCFWTLHSLNGKHIMWWVLLDSESSLYNYIGTSSYYYTLHYVAHSELAWAKSPSKMSKTRGWSDSAHLISFFFQIHLFGGMCVVIWLGAAFGSTRRMWKYGSLSK